jgi:nicotinamidase-related amidase
MLPWLILGADLPIFRVTQEVSLDPYVNAHTIAARAAEWLITIHPFNQHKMELRRETSALLVIDMQEFFLDPQSPSYTCGGLAILPALQRLIAAFREAGRPVIYTKHVHHPDHLDSGIMGWWWKGMCIEGSPESEIHRDLAPLPAEKVVLKHRYSAFYNTDLETILRCQRIEDLVITGIMTNMCCESTARDAYFRDYRVFFLADGTGSINEEMQIASLLNLAFGFAHVTTADRIIDDVQRPSFSPEPAAAREGVELKPT